MNPPRSPGSPSEQSPAATPFAAGGERLSALGKLLSQPFMVEDVSEAGSPLFVAMPLKFLRFDHASGRCVDHALHSKPNSERGG